MKRKNLAYILGVIILLDVLFTSWKSTTILNYLIELRFLKDEFVHTTSQAIRFYGASILSLFLVTISAVLLLVGAIKSLLTKRMNRLLQVHISINLLMLIFCFPLTLIKSGDQLVSLMGISIFNNFFYAVIILAEVIFYTSFIQKKVIWENDKKPILLRRFFNLIIDSFIVLTLVFFIKDILYFNFSHLNVNHSTITLIILFFYYFFSELILKQTVGKVITNTQVLTSNNIFKQVAIRSLCRLIPFYQLSPFIGDRILWHDKFSKSSVVTCTPDN